MESTELKQRLIYFLLAGYGVKSTEQGIEELDKELSDFIDEVCPVENRVMPNEVLAGEQFEKVLIGLVVSNYRLGVAEYKRNPNYNNEHYHHKAEVGLLDYIEEHNLELWGKIQNALNELEE